VKKTILYFFILTLGFASFYESTRLLLKVMGQSTVVWSDDFHCEEQDSEGSEENQEPKGAKEKSEKSEFNSFSAEPGMQKLRASHSALPDRYGRACYLHFSSADFSQKIYSPPESV
jgi:hypothetical protein